MDDRIAAAFRQYADENLEQIILSNSADKDLQKVKIRPLLIKGELCFQAEEFRGVKAFHKNLTAEELISELPAWFCVLRQGEIHHRDADVTILLSKKGTVTVKKKMRPKTSADVRPFKLLTHNREKKSLLFEGTAVPFLCDLGIMNAEGFVVKGKYDKFRQINRFLEFIEDVRPELPDEGREMNVLDFGCGKSYLTFAMYYYLKELCGKEVRITGLDLKEDVINNCSRLAEKYGYTGLKFLHKDVADYNKENSIDMMVTLHACDTATDYALWKAVQWNAKVILSVPCCQHEVNAQLSSDVMEPLFRYGLIKERTAALITDALRAELLTACGYRVQILEFIEMEHTPKNLLIRAVKKEKADPKECRQAWKRCTELAGQLNIEPKLMVMLRKNFETTEA